MYTHFELRTARMRLVAATAETARLEIADRPSLGRLLGALIPAAWPPPALAEALPFFEGILAAHPAHAGWYGWYGIALVFSPTPVLVASAGFKGPPEEGGVELGYEVLPGFRGQGFAAEMAGALTTWALERPGVQRVVADVRPDNEASRRLLGRLGFTPCDETTCGVPEPGHDRFVRLRDAPSPPLKG